MSVKLTVDRVRDLAATRGLRMPMARGRDLVATVLYGRSYSACMAAESAGRRPALGTPLEIGARVLDHAPGHGDALSEAIRLGVGAPPEVTGPPEPIESMPLPRSRADVFHRVRIDGVVFSALLIPEGPYLQTEKPERGGVALGVCGMAQLPKGSRGMNGEISGWWICKYSVSEPRIDVNALSPLGRKLLMREFGIAPVDDADDFGRRFLKSPAIHALARWVAAHPRTASRLSSNCDYIPDWYRVAAAMVGA